MVLKSLAHQLGVARQRRRRLFERTKFQSRRSLLIWKIFGRRMDGWTNDDFPTVRELGNARSLVGPGGKPVENLDYNDEQALQNFVRRDFSKDVDFTGSIMPPPAAMRSGNVQPLSDEDRRTIVRWIDLGCPIDIEKTAAKLI